MYKIRLKTEKIIKLKNRIKSTEFFVGTNKRNMLAKSWAGPDSHHADPYASTAKPRDYSRPWLSGSRPIRAKSTEKDNLRRERTPERTKEREPWNRSTITPTQDFDELFEMRQKAKTESTGNNAGYYGGTEHVLYCLNLHIV